MQTHRGHRIPRWSARYDVMRREHHLCDILLKDTNLDQSWGDTRHTEIEGWSIRHARSTSKSIQALKDKEGEEGRSLKDRKEAEQLGGRESWI